MVKKLVVALFLVCILPIASTYADNISVTDDAFTNSFTKNMNYGNNSTLSVGEGLVADYRTYLKFDLSAYSGIQSAYLYLFQDVGASNAGIDTYSTLTNWTESTIKWNNQPVLSGSYVTTQVNFTPGWYAWDVTSFAQSAEGSDFSLALVSGGAVHVFNSSEGLSQYSPYLSVTAVPEPISTALFIIGGASLAARRIRRKK